MEPIKSTRVQRTEEEIFKLMEEFESSASVSVKEFCEMYDISTGTFYNWQKQYRSRIDKTSGFVSVSVVKESGEMDAILFAEVRGIRLYREVSASFLKELIYE